MRTLTTLFGITLLVGAAIAYWTLVPRDAGNVLDVLPTITTTTAPTRSFGPSAVPPSGGADQAASLVRAPALLDAVDGTPLPSVPSPLPTRLRIPSLGVDADILALGVEENGEMEVPDQVDDVGWYRYGSAPGESGSAVLAAHVDSRSQGPGVFFRLGTLSPGAVIDVETSMGEVLRFVVRAVSTIDKDELPIDRIFARDGESTLTLITCGGSFSAAQRSYDSNVVVVATPES